ncbi:MAG: glycosyltransferase family 39 protein [Dehalococcoidia bacterium]|nr:glycosyltransferase family 39 protein [Dehalococcoidia bacterium]
MDGASRLRRQRRADPVIVVALLVAALARFAGLPDRGLWRDEWVVALAAAGEGGIPYDLLGAPLTGLTQGWAFLAGASALSVRWPSAMAGVVAVAAVGPIAWRLGGRPLARWAVWLAATSPLAVLFDRMAVGISMVTALTLVATWWFLSLSGSRPRRWGFTGAMAIIGLVAPSAAAGLMFAQGALLRGRLAPEQAWRRWLVSAGVTTAAIALGLAAGRGDMPPPTGDLGGQAATVGVKVAIVAASFAIGQTLYPWTPMGVLGIGVTLTLAARGLQWLPSAGRQFLLLFSVTPVGWIALVTSMTGTTPTLTTPALVAFAWPFFGLMMAAGLRGIAVWQRQAAFAALTMVAAFALGNYWAGREFMTPAYAAPADQAMAYLGARQSIGDVVVAGRETLIPLVAAKRGSAWTLPILIDESRTDTQIRQELPPRVWLARLVGREEEPSWAGQEYRLAERREIPESDSALRWLRQQLGDPDDASIVVTRWDRRAGN